ncbi:MFS transporter [Streptomyces sp. NPDC097619]|uniref:MFS transporter n=1 Tax=Streptomyces sp. NPDC097619 TaxID=3157228 RepID=UPI003331365C
MTATAPPLLLVDGHHLLYRAHFGFPKRFEALDGTDVTCAFGFVALLRKAHREHGAGHEVLVVFDAEDGADGRIQAEAGYKANRADADHSPIRALAPLKAMLDLGAVRWLEGPGAEGDDVVTTIATREAAAGRAVVVLSGDRDLYGLLARDGIRILNPLPGVQDVGPVTATRLLTGDRRLEGPSATAPGRLAKPLARIRETWDEVVRVRSVLRLTCDLPYPSNTVTGMVTPGRPRRTDEGGRPVVNTPLTSAAVPTPAARASLRGHRSFSAYLAGQSASLIGTAVHGIALPTLAVLHLKATPGQVSLLFFLIQIPTFVFALPAGAIIDRHHKKTVLVVTDLAAAVVVAVIPAVTILGTLTMPVLYAVALTLGAVTVLHQAAAIAIVPQLVEPELLQLANSRIGAAFGAADTAGTYLGTAVVAVVGAGRAFALDTVSYLVSAWCATRIHTGHAPPSARARRTMAADIWEGLLFVARTPLVRPLVLCLAGTGFGSALTSTFWAFHLLTTVKTGTTGLGVIMGVSGAGCLAGALATPRIVRRFGPVPVLIAGFAMYPLTTVPLLFARTGTLWLLVLAAAGGLQLAAAACAGTTQRSVRQQICPPELQARAQQTSTWLVTGSRPFAALTAGALASVTNVWTVLLAGALVLTLPVLVLWRSPVARLTSMPVPASTVSAGTTRP